MMEAMDHRPAFQLLHGKTPAELFSDLPTPCYIIDEAGLQKNGEILSSVIKNTGCKILLAQKAFSNYDFYPLLSGTEASGLFEARLGAEKMPGKEVHIFCAAYRDDEFDEILKYADHIVFNSPGQLKKYGQKAKSCGKSIGLRINPQCSTQEGHEIYDPCSSTSRDYDVSLLEKLITYAKDKWNVDVYLEPGKAVALNAGYLACHVLDIVQNADTRIAVLDVSAACHMPDVIEMPYMPPLYGGTEEKNDGDSYLLAGPTCLAGDVIGRYRFHRELRPGDLLLFGDMAIYSTCKNNTFNGMPLPDIWRRNIQGEFEKLTCFGYEDFKMRLGK